MTLGYLFILRVTPTAAFRSSTNEQRLATLESIAARLQEWTGELGGVIFSERVPIDQETWSVVLCITVRDKGLTEAIVAEVKNNEQDFGVQIIAHGQHWGILRDDPEDAARVTKQILSPFLD
jgi:hypothetical protein